jgi:hypothetical protein
VPVVATLLAGTLPAQAVPRADLPAAGRLRVTFDPRVSVWDDVFVAGTRRPLGAFLTADSLGGAQLPQLARLDQDLLTATGAPGHLATLGAARLTLRAERRVTPLLLELGISDRLAVGVRVPLVRVNMRAAFTLDSTDGNLGLNPRADPGAGADAIYAAFFQSFDAALAQLAQNIVSGSYGCPGSPQCAAAQAFGDTAAAVRDALFRTALGGGGADAAPFLPTTSSAAGLALDANLTRLQQEFAATWAVGGFTDAFLLPTQRAAATDFHSILADPLPGYGAGPLIDTRRALRFWLGDIELETRYALARGPRYRATLGALVRLPTGHQDSPHNLIDLAAGDAQLDVEGQVTQELVVGSRLWLNLALRAGLQTAGERDRRVAPGGSLFAPRAATARLAWDPGDYVALDFAPLYRFTPAFAAGVTAGFSTQGRDRYAFRAAADSLAVAGALGTPVAAGVLDAGTAVREARIGGAVTFSGPVLEGSLSVERTVSGRGGTTPAATVLRIVLRTSRRLF